MYLSSPEIKVVLSLGIFALATGFVFEKTSQPLDNPTKGHLQNVSLQRLDSCYLRALYPDVTFLKISNSKIEEVDKYAFDYLTHLNLLEISDNEIRNPIDPQTFSRLPGLEILILRNVGLRRVNLNLTHVQELVLASNEIEVFEGASTIGKNVNFLDLNNNKLRDLNSSFASMSKLSMIDISRNKINEVFNVFDENVNLLRILASENKITTTSGLKLPWLKTLDLFANRIVTLDSESFSKMVALEELVLAFNFIKVVGDAFKDLIELKYLNLAWNHIEDLHPEVFRNNLYLTKLSLQGNKIRALEKFQNALHHLTHLDLSHNQLALLDDDFFRSTPSLQVLDLSFNRLKMLGHVLAPLTELKILNAAYNDLEMTGYELSANDRLSRLNLSSNSLQVGLSLFESNRLLSNLDLSQNEISLFCDKNVSLKNLQKVNLRENQIKSLTCLKEFQALCEIDLRSNPLTCGEELDGLMLALVEKGSSPFNLSPEFQSDLIDQCENLALNQSFLLWNSIKRELCPKGRDLESKILWKKEGSSQEWENTEAEDGTDGIKQLVEATEKSSTSEEANPHKKPFIVLPIGWIKNDEMNKPNPMQSPQSERMSWEKIEENPELLNDLEDEESGKKPRFSWYTIALILIGLSLTLTCFNLVVFLYIRMKLWKKSDVSSPQKYTFLHNEVYKNTTEPTKVCQIGDGNGDWSMENQTKNKIFSYGRINELLLNFRLNKKDKDSESATNILINPTSKSQNC